MAIDVWEWLSLIDHDGPFLSKAALKSFYPSGLPRSTADESGDVFVDEFIRWSAAWSAPADVYNLARDRWVTAVLHRLLDWADELQPSPTGLAAQSPNGTVNVTPYAALAGDDGPSTLVTVVDRTDDLRAAGTDGWSANAIDRMAVLLRETGVTIGIVTDGRWWALVSAAKGVTTASGVWDALLWREERPSRDAFLALASYTSIAGGAPEKQLPAVFAKSVASAEEITEALGDQVRRAVELVLQSMSDTHLRALAQGEPSPLPEDPKAAYEGAVTVLMRIVFLLFAEERGLLPEHDLYRSSYAIARVREQLQQDATATSVAALDHSWEAWHRLLAASNAVFGGASFQDMRMPAYGGSLFDPLRFPWLHATDSQGRLRVRLTDRAMLAVLRAVQTIEDGAMQLSFRDLDVEQIGYVYEGLLGYSAVYVREVTVGLEGKSGFEPEIALTELEEITDVASSPADFAKRLVEHLKKTQEQSKPRTANQITKAYGTDDAAAAADARTRLRYALLGDDDLAARLEPFHGLIRSDLRGFPYVVPAEGLVMTESPQRANTGTHYTPRALAEEVVLHALEPLVYSPGPLDTENRSEWKLKSSSEILDLKVADIAAGSGAFLVAAARYLADRLIEARANEGLETSHESDLKRWAIREIVARCLYGADINGMAVEMCKLSLWLISMDAGKPFSFVDDRVFHGNSLLGVTTEEQLKAQHIYPERRHGREQLLWFDVDKDLDDAARIRRELTSGQVDDSDRMRSTKAKQALLAQAEQVTAKLRDIADGIIAAGLLDGGKQGKKLDDRYTDLADALRTAYPADDTAPDRTELDAIIDSGLAPTVNTGEARWKPLHWILEAPDVIRAQGGFDAIIGNPPFLVGKDVPAAIGNNVREFLVAHVASGERGKADLAAYFVRRSASLVAPSGVIALITPKAIAEGITRVVALDPLVPPMRITHAVRSQKWPTSSASTRISQIALTARSVRTRVLADGELVPRISSSLDPVGAEDGRPKRIAVDVEVDKGSELHGDGFLIDKERANEILQDHSMNSAVLRPYINGFVANASFPPHPEQFAIDFREMPEPQAREYSVLFEIVERRVLPERLELDPAKYPRLVNQWWKHPRTRPEMYPRIRRRAEVIAIAAVSKHAVPVYVPTEAVLSSALVVFDSDAPSLYALLSSNVHRSWLLRWGSTMQTDLRYAVSDIWRTFPTRSLSSLRLIDLGVQLRSLREQVGRARSLGPTGVHSLVDNEHCSEGDVIKLRDLIKEIDVVLIEQFGWTQVNPEWTWSEYRNVTRFGFAPQSRIDILDRLLRENHHRAEVEHRAVMKPRRVRSLEDLGRPEGAIF